MKDFENSGGVGSKEKDNIPPPLNLNLPPISIGENKNETKGEECLNKCNNLIIVSESEDEVSSVPGLSPENGQIHSKILTAFTKAFAKQNVHFEKAIQGLEDINEQILSFLFSPTATESSTSFSNAKNGDPVSQTICTAIHLMRKLLLDAQSKFRKMVDDNKSLGGRLDVDLQSAHEQMALLRAELSDTNRRLSAISSPPSTPSTPSHTNNREINGFDGEEPMSELEKLSGEELRKEFEKVVNENRKLKREVKKYNRESTSSDVHTDLQHAKEALSALKGDRKRLKAEKFELLNQMKELYVTLEDKERELREFIRSYEGRMRESEATQVRLVSERDEAERERWTILRHARDEAERGLSLAQQLTHREAQVQNLQEELHEAKRQLSQYGLYSEPNSSTNATTSHYSLVSSLAANYGTLADRGSSADSGVRLSSDRDSTHLKNGSIPNHSHSKFMTHQTNSGPSGNLSDSPNEGALDLCGEGSGGDDSMSVISTATLPQLFLTSRDSPSSINYASLTRSLDTNSLSRSAEQLLAAEAAERRKNGRRSMGGTGAKGAWGSISRVFARNKQRRNNLDPSSLYDSHSVGGQQRSSWSPQTSTPHSPLGETESYGDKLRALEEAATLPMEMWRAVMVQAWIEVSLGMPQYGSRCGDNIKSGKVLLELSDSELESELGISHPLHRKKLRLAIEEHRNPALVRFPCIVELSHVWVSSEWLPDIGLPQYADNFAGGLVDARLLDHLSKKDLEKYLGVTRKFHLAAIAHGVHLLRMVAYDRQILAERRRQCENDPLVWTNQHFIQWARSIDLNEYTENLKGSGVHGAFAVLEPSFNGDTLASAMGIPNSKQIIRRHLSAELELLLNPARSKITQQYRVSKSRFSTLERNRGDSLGRNATPPLSGGSSSDSFRRSNDESRRKTSLRGSLSRALGLKIKQDLAAQRTSSDKSVNKNYDKNYEISKEPPPPLPPGLPGKLPENYNKNSNGTSHFFSFKPSPYVHSPSNFKNDLENSEPTDSQTPTSDEPSSPEHQLNSHKNDKITENAQKNCSEVISKNNGLKEEEEIVSNGKEEKEKEGVPLPGPSKRAHRRNTSISESLTLNLPNHPVHTPV